MVILACRCVNWVCAVERSVVSVVICDCASGGILAVESLSLVAERKSASVREEVESEALVRRAVSSVVRLEFSAFVVELSASRVEMRFSRSEVLDSDW